MNRRRLAPLAFAAAAALWLGGCQSAPAVPADYAPLVARFYLETKPAEAGLAVQLPQSGVAINVGPKPVFVEYDIVNAEVTQVDLGQCLLFQLTPAASRDLYRLSVASVGRRLVLSLNDKLVGARRIERAMGDGNILVFVELPDADLPGLVARLKRTAVDIVLASQKKKST
ncbi:MAG: hypothetical protein HY302_02815 [Opitutae bacterium]|nr:hypothetical protein [Opitutae bacterium]